MNRLRLALTKGRIEKQTIALFEKIGYDCSQIKEKGRRLILEVEDFDVLLAKPDDVITYIEYGVCDLGIVGKDTIAEKDGKFYEVLDLGFGKCKFALANKKNVDFYEGSGVKTIATKYPNIARSFFESKNMDVRIIKIEGSVEVAPILGLADGIVDIVETGNTLVANGLEVKEDIMDISSRLIVNTASMKLKMDKINNFISKLESVI
ncbi:ATP phosphoribosyltransferase [Clostridia bacterium]|nr:ATP phosphoribosyltransferase [Clostridia bacterium]